MLPRVRPGKGEGRAPGWAFFRVLPICAVALCFLSTAEADTWSRVWTKTRVSGGPDNRQAHSAVTMSLAAGKEAIVVYGGFGAQSDSDFLSDTWRFDVDSGTWASMAASANPKPSARASHSAVLYRAASGQQYMVVFGGAVRGGSSSSLRDLGDVWSLNLRTERWSQLKPKGDAAPSPRNEHVACVRGESMFVFGGVYTTDSSLTPYDDLWQLHFVHNEWRQVVPATAAGPHARFSHAGVLLRPLPRSGQSLGSDVLDPSLLGQGGAVGAGSDGHSDSGLRWRRLRHAGPIPVIVAEESGTGADDTFGLDGARGGDWDDHFVAVGGSASPLQARDAAGSPVPVPVPALARQLAGSGSGGASVAANATNGTDWLNATNSSADASGSGSGSGALGPVSPVLAADGSFVVFGGRWLDRKSGQWHMLNDMWAFVFDDDVDDRGRGMAWAAGSWVEQELGGYAFARSYHSLCAWRGSVVVFGGYVRLPTEREGQDVGYVFNDLLLADVPPQGGGWGKAIVAGSPPPVRFDHAAATSGDMMYVYGGRFDTMQRSLWSVNLSSIVTTPATQEDFLAASTLVGFFSTAHFMIAVLSLMAICFCGFLTSLRRHSMRYGGGGGMGRGAGGLGRDDPSVEHPGRPVGTPAHVVRDLPMVVYRPLPPPGPPGDDDDDDSGSAAVAGAGAPAAGVDGGIELTAVSTGALASARGGDADAAGDSIAAAQSTCSICLCDFEEGEQLNELPCRHRYHPACIHQWLKTSSTCPLCKSDVQQGMRGRSTSRGASMSMVSSATSPLPGSSGGGDGDDADDEGGEAPRVRRGSARRGERGGSGRRGGRVSARATD